MLAAGTTAGSAAAQTAPAPIPWSPLIDHIQINSRDPQKAAEFYQRVMGLELLRVGPAGPDRDCCPNESAFLGVGQRLILAIRRREPYGVIDHWAMLAPGYTGDQFRAAIQERGGEFEGGVPPGSRRRPVSVHGGPSDSLEFRDVKFVGYEPGAP